MPIYSIAILLCGLLDKKNESGWMMKWSGFKKNGFLPESSAYALGWAKLSFMPNFKFSNP